jgi:acylphosphatase
MVQHSGPGRRRVIYSGQVQGVGFRYRTLTVARRFAVVGFVRNLADGTVELVAEGDPGELEGFLGAIRDEMSGYIQGEQQAAAPANGEFSRFVIQH